MSSDTEDVIADLMSPDANRVDNLQRTADDYLANLFHVAMSTTSSLRKLLCAYPDAEDASGIARIKITALIEEVVILRWPHLTIM